MKNNQPNHWWDTPSVIIFAIALWVAAWRLEVTRWTHNLDTVEFLLLIAMILGALLGRSRFKSRTTFVFGVIYGLFFVGWQIGVLLKNTMTWNERLVSIVGRVNAVLFALFNNIRIEDTLPFLLGMSALFWIFGMVGMYQLVRNNRPWVVLAMAAVATFIFHHYSQYVSHGERYLFIFILCTLLLIGRVYYLNNRRQWLERGYAVDSETGFSLGRAILISSVMLLVVAWSLPVPEQISMTSDTTRLEVTGWWENVKERFGNATAGLQSPVVYINDSYAGMLNLGTRISQSDDVVFRVEASTISTNFRYYWRGSSYDTYNGEQWTNSVETRGEALPEEWPLAPLNFAGRRNVELSFQTHLATMEKVYVPNRATFISRSVRYIGESSDEGVYDLVTVLASPRLHAGDVYEARALISEPTQSMLRAAGTAYPGWVVTRYLQLPENFSERVQAKAEEIAANYDNPYDIAHAITRYLRVNIEYQGAIETPPEDQDVMEWFLFDYKKGFCNYYATAEVLMLRSLGIPARLATGYAQGEQVEGENAFEVRVNDSHAWPEVYFPGYGWVEFEPTAAQPAYELREGVSSADSLEGNEIQFPPPLDNRPSLEDMEQEDIDPGVAERAEPLSRAIPIVITSTALVAFAIGGFFLLRRYPVLYLKPFPQYVEEIISNDFFSSRGVEVPKAIYNWARYTELTPMERIFRRVDWMLWLLAVRPAPGMTPSEKMDLLVRRVPLARSEASVLLEEYHIEVFSRRYPDLTRAKMAHSLLWNQVIKTAWKQLFRR